MGLLDRLIRKEISKGVGGLVSGAIVDAINSSSEKNNQNTQPSQYQTTGVNHDTSGPSSYSYGDPNVQAQYAANQNNYNYESVPSQGGFNYQSVQSQNSGSSNGQYQTSQNVPYNTAENMKSGNAALSIGNAEENFYQVLSNAFPEYTINRHIPSQKYGAPGYAQDYTFGLYKDGYPELFIMLVPHNKYRKFPYAHAKDASLASGVPFQFYYLHFDNRYSYVVDRVKSALKH